MNKEADLSLNKSDVNPNDVDVPLKKKKKIKAKKSTKILKSKSAVKVASAKSLATPDQAIKTMLTSTQAADLHKMAANQSPPNSIASTDLVDYLNSNLKNASKSAIGIEKAYRPNQSLAVLTAYGVTTVEHPVGPLLAPQTPKKSRSRKIKKSRRGSRKNSKRRAAAASSKSLTSTDMPQHKNSSSVATMGARMSAINGKGVQQEPEFVVTPLLNNDEKTTKLANIRKKTVKRSKSQKQLQGQKVNDLQLVTNDVLAQELQEAKPNSGKKNKQGKKVGKAGAAGMVSKKGESKSKSAAELFQTNGRNDHLYHLYRLQNELQSEVTNLMSEIENDRKNRIAKEAKEKNGNDDNFKTLEPEKLGKFCRLLENQKQIIQIQIDLCEGLTTPGSDPDIRLEGNQVSSSTLYGKETAPESFEHFAPYAREQDGKMVFYCSLCDVSSESELLFRLHLESPEHHRKILKDIERDVPEKSTPNRGRPSLAENLKRSKKILKPEIHRGTSSAPQKPMAPPTSGGEMLQSLI